MPSFSVNHMGTIIQVGSPEMLSMLDGAIIDLSGGAKLCQFGYAVATMDEGAYDAGFIVTDSETLIGILIYGAVTELEAAQGKSIEFPQGHKVYDCQTAMLMGMYAAYTRGTPYDGSGYVLTMNDVYNLLARNQLFQEEVNRGLVASGKYSGPLSGNNSIPLVKTGHGLFSKPANTCPATVTVIDGETLPTVGGIDVVGAYQEDEGYGWKLWAGVGALAVASVVGYKMVKKGR